MVLAFQVRLFHVFLFLLWKSKGLMMYLINIFVAFREFVLSLFFHEIQEFIILFRLEFIDKVLDLIVLLYFLLIMLAMFFVAQFVIIFLIIILVFLCLAKFLKFHLQLILFIFFIHFLNFIIHFHQNKFLHQ